MTTREKLAAVLCIDDASKAVATLDALEAIVTEARDEAIEECAKHLDRQKSPMKAGK